MQEIFTSASATLESMCRHKNEDSARSDENKSMPTNALKRYFIPINSS